MPYKEHQKLSVLLTKLLPSNEQIDIRDNWHSYFFSEGILTDKIEHEVVIQKPGHAIFLSLHSLHQVINQGAGMNIAWNLAVFTYESVLDLMTGYDFEILVQKRIPVIPVPRIIHILLFKFNDLLSDSESLQMVRFLLNYFKIEQELFSDFVKGIPADQLKENN